MSFQNHSNSQYYIIIIAFLFACQNSFMNVQINYPTLFLKVVPEVGASVKVTEQEKAQSELRVCDHLKRLCRWAPVDYDVSTFLFRLAFRTNSLHRFGYDYSFFYFICSLTTIESITKVNWCKYPSWQQVP